MSSIGKVVVVLLLISNAIGIEYELVYGTTFRGDAPSGNSVSMQLTGSNGKTTDVINLPGHRKSGEDRHKMYQRDIGTPTCVWLKVNGNDGWMVSQFQVKIEGDDTWYTTGTLDYDLDDNASKKWCDLQPAIEYKVDTVTSRSGNAGTDDEILVKLRGTKGTTRERSLDTPADDFKIGATDNFSFYDIDIGVLECIDTRIIGNDGWKVERIEAEIGDARSKYKTESLETWLDDNSKEEFCDLIAEDSCDCSSALNDNWELTDIKYNIVKANVDSMTPEQVGSQTIKNSLGSASQSSQFAVRETVTETARFTQTSGASVTVGTSFKVSVPAVAESTVSASMTATASFSSGEDFSVSKFLQSTFNCIAPPYTNVVCTALLQKYTATVPYVQTWTHKTHGCSCTSEGVFTESGASDMTLDINGKRSSSAPAESSGGFDELKGIVPSVIEDRA